MDLVEQSEHQTLVVKSQLGDRAALEALFVRHNRALGYYLGRLLQVEDVRDVQQEVWLLVIRRIRKLRTPAAFVVWLYRIARSRALDRLSALQRAERLIEPEAPEPAAAEPEPQFDAADAEQIHQLLHKLAPAHREALVLRFIEDLSYEQIAEVIGCNAGTVRSRLHYAKQAMRKLLVEAQT